MHIVMIPAMLRSYTLCLMTMGTTSHPAARAHTTAASIGGWWIWVYWMSPMSWTLRCATRHHVWPFGTRPRLHYYLAESTIQIATLKQARAVCSRHVNCVHRTLVVNELTSSDWDITAAPWGPSDQSLGKARVTHA